MTTTDTDELTERIGRILNEEGWTWEGVHEPGEYDECEDCRRAVEPMAIRIAQKVADEVRKAKAEAWEECATKIEMQGTIKPGAVAEILMPKGYVINPATKRESAEEAAHDYTRRNIGPSVGTIADRLEIAFLAGAQWALTHSPTQETSKEAE